MQKIRFITRIDDFNKREWYREAKLVETLPEADEEFFNGERIVSVRDIKPARITEYTNYSTEEFDFYEVVRETEPIDEDDQPEQFVEYYAIRRPEPEPEDEDQDEDE